jgi:tetratricopeptide (TPR) repeat protein
MVDAHDASPLTAPSRMVAHLKAWHLDTTPRAMARLPAGLAGGALLVPSLEWHAGQPEVPLRATRAAGGAPVLHAFTDVAALRAAAGSASWAAYRFPEIVSIARAQRCEAVVVNEAGPWTAVLVVADLDVAASPNGTAPADAPVPDRRAVEATRERSAELRRVAEERRRSGDRDEARAALVDALALHEEIGDLLHAGFALGDLGAVDCLLGRHDEAAQELDRSLNLFRYLRNRQGEALAEANLGWLALARDDRQSALDRASAALAQAAEPAFRSVAVRLAEALAKLALQDLALRDLALEDGDVEPAVAAARLSERPELLAAALSARGWVAFRDDRVDAAAADFAEEEQVAATTGDAAVRARAELDLAWLDARVGDCPAARGRAERAVVIDPGPETGAAAAALLLQVEQMERLSGQSGPPPRNGAGRP